MTLPDFQAQLDAHLATRPVTPCAVIDMTPDQYAEWSHELARWALKRDTLRGLTETAAHPIEYKRPAPRCTPRADDYYYREPLKRRRKAA